MPTPLDRIIPLYRERFPYNDLVMEWHDNGTGHWGIMDAKRQGTRG